MHQSIRCNGQTRNDRKTCESRKGGMRRTSLRFNQWHDIPLAKNRSSSDGFSFYHARLFRWRPENAKAAHIKDVIVIRLPLPPYSCDASAHRQDYASKRHRTRYVYKSRSV